ncbi:MAG: leucine-rich repeat protein, partial [Intestinibacter sp.]|uniref:leucine-rich repeat protein n=1 Tax=Intestinibacter sp. TaxID=1965304 RepID=UPI003F156235
IETVEGYVFLECTGLKTVEISEGVTSLGNKAFCGCTALESISLPSTLTDINGYQFENCTSLKEIKIAGSNYKVEDTIVYTADGKTLVFCSPNYVGSLKVPETVTEINDAAFFTCKNLTQITLPESLTKIGEDAFYGCQYLMKMTIPKNVTELGAYAFYGCTGLEDIVISSDITSLGYRTFSGCVSLKNVTLPSTIESIGDYAFEKCTSLTKLDLPDGLTSLGASAFENCNVLEDIQIPSSVTSLGKSCFKYCYALKNIEIPDGITIIPMYFLQNCNHLETVIIPKSVTSIQSNAFASTQKSLKFIYYKGSEEEWNAVKGSSKPSNPKWSAVIVYNYSKIGDSADAPVIVEQPQDKTFSQNADATNALKVKVEAPNDGEKIYINWYSNSKNSTEGGTKVDSTIDEDGVTSYATPSTETIGNKYYYCVVVKVTEDGTVTMSTSDVAVVAVRMNTFSGNGTQKKPYLLSSVEDLQTLYNLVSEGSSMEGIYFKMVDDITLPDDWTPIGVLKEGATEVAQGKNMLPFSGVLDGNNHTITVARGGQPLLGYVREATVKNLNIYGEYIAEDGLVANYVVDYGTDGNYSTGCPNTIDITNVTIKSGTTIKGSGLIGGYASGSNTVRISNCTVESGVKVGWDADTNESAGQNNIGSLAGEFNGTIADCVSNAEVYGVDNIGGLMGQKGQSMGTCSVKNSQFNGVVNATGNYIGGIVGSGYSAESAPNTPGTSIENCTVTGTINGGNYVGGIFGGESAQEQAWENSYIRNNYFKGKINATGNYVGGVIGYMRSLNRYNIIENNYYIASCGADKGIGGALYVDTSAVEHGWTSDKSTYYMNTSVDNIATIKQETNVDSQYTNISRTDCNRSDDPLGADKYNLAKPMNAMITVTFDDGNGKVVKIVDQDEKLDYTPENPAKEGYAFAGWYKDVNDTTTAYKSGNTYTENITYKAKWAHVQMLGAQGKLVVDGKSGIRFGTKIYNDGDQIVEKGTLIIPANLLSEGEELTLDTKKAAKSIGKVNYEVNKEQNYLTYLGTIGNIPNTQFDRQMTAVAYVIYKDKAGNEYTVYSQYPNGST